MYWAIIGGMKKASLLPPLFFFAVFFLGVFAYPSPIFSAVEVNAVVPGVCGNGLKEIGEQCDGLDLGGSQCSLLGYPFGSLGCNAACSYDISACSNTVMGGSGTGGALTPVGRTESLNSIPTSVVLSGYGYPGTSVRLFMDGLPVLSTRTDFLGVFSFTSRDLIEGVHTFSVGLLEESEGRSLARTSSVSVFLEEGTVTQIEGVVFPPRITNIDFQKDRRELTVSGRALPQEKITITIEAQGSPPIEASSRSDAGGRWSLMVNTKDLLEGQKKEEVFAEISSRMVYEGQTYLSPVVRSSFFDKKEKQKERSRDLNQDEKIDFLDFYIMRFWYHTDPLRAPDFVDLSQNGRLTLEDFSVLFSLPEAQKAKKSPAEIAVKLGSDRLRIGESVSGEVSLLSKNTPVNAFRLQLVFDDKRFELSDVSFVPSVVGKWITKPKASTPSEREESAGAFPDGFTGVRYAGSDEQRLGTLFSFTLRAISSGTSTVSVSQARVFTGKGETMPVEILPQDIFVRPVQSATPSKGDDIRPDTEAPLPFQPAIIRPTPNEKGLRYVVFDTADRGSGVGYFQVAITDQKPTEDIFGSSDIQWTLAESPFELPRLLGDQWVIVRAVDEMGNSRFGVTAISSEVEDSNEWIFFLILFFLILSLLYQIGKKYDKDGTKLKLAWKRIAK